LPLGAFSAAGACPSDAEQGVAQGGSGGSAPKGLSTAHIPALADRGASKCRFEVDFFPGLVAAKVNPEDKEDLGRMLPQPCRSPARGVRGVVKGFSRPSRLRLTRRFGMIRRDVVPVLITMTYPGEYSDEAETWKRDLENFFRRVAREYPQASCFWKLEFQKRGAPHFHLLVWGIPPNAQARAWVSKVWFEVVGSGDERHLRAGTQIQRVENWRQASSYCAKYLGKTDEEEHPRVGRVWGIRKRALIPWADPRRLTLTMRQMTVLTRWMRRGMRHKAMVHRMRKALCWTAFGLGPDWYHATRHIQQAF